MILLIAIGLQKKTKQTIKWNMTTKSTALETEIKANESKLSQSEVCVCVCVASWYSLTSCYWCYWRYTSIFLLNVEFDQRAHAKKIR